MYATGSQQNNRYRDIMMHINISAIIKTHGSHTQTHDGLTNTYVRVVHTRPSIVDQGYSFSYIIP